MHWCVPKTPEKMPKICWQWCWLIDVDGIFSGKVHKSIVDLLLLAKRNWRNFIVKLKKRTRYEHRHYHHCRKFGGISAIIKGMSELGSKFTKVKIPNENSWLTLSVLPIQHIQSSVWFFLFSRSIIHVGSDFAQKTYFFINYFNISCILQQSEDAIKYIRKFFSITN